MIDLITDRGGGNRSGKQICLTLSFLFTSLLLMEVFSYEYDGVRTQIAYFHTIIVIHYATVADDNPVFYML